MTDCGLLTAVIGAGSAIAGSVVGAVVQYCFSKRQDRRKARLEIAGNVAETYGHLLETIHRENLAGRGSPESLKAGAERDRHIQALRALRAAMIGLFSKGAQDAFGSFDAVLKNQYPGVTTEPQTAVETLTPLNVASEAEKLIKALYKEAAK
jgi:hypothetical protein